MGARRRAGASGLFLRLFFCAGSSSRGRGALFQRLAQAQVFIAQTGCLRPRHEGIARKVGHQFQLITLHELFHFVRLRPGRGEREITFKVMQRHERLLHLVVVEKRELIVHLRGLRRAIQRALIEVDRIDVFAGGHFSSGVFFHLGGSRCNHAIASGKEHKGKNEDEPVRREGVHFWKITKKVGIGSGFRGKLVRPLILANRYAMMRARCLPILLVGLLVLGVRGVVAGEWEVGSTHSLSFQDVDGNEISTAGGRVTIITVVTRAQEDNARAVADLVPDPYMGNPQYRYVTLVNFQGKLAGPLQGLTRAVIRNRLNAEARELRPQYLEKKIERDPRGDLHVIADFDGSASKRLGLSESAAMAVFVFDGAGKLLGRWDGVPPGDTLAKVLETTR